MSWWFWIKAGIGFTIGASTVGILVVMASWVLSLAALGALLGLARH